MKTPLSKADLVRHGPRSLMAQFLLMAAAVLFAGLCLIGLWVTSRIETGVIDNAGTTTALYVDALITPLVQPLALEVELSPAHADELRNVLRRGALSTQVSLFKLWAPSGRIVFSDNPELIGTVPEASPGLEAALSGRVHATFEQAFHHPADGESGAPLLEIYSPVRSTIDGQIIAVAEFYTAAEALAGHLQAARVQSWVVVGLVSLAMFLALSAVVARGSRTIAAQRRSLDVQVNELSSLLAANKLLTQRVEQANHRIASLNESNLRRISADLHDGPVQQLAFAALRLDPPQDERQAQVRQAIDEALEEIRHICSGLSLPELDDWSLATIARRLIASHAARTGITARLALPPDLPDMPPVAKICIYRFLQEGLTNGAKHGKGTNQAVRLLSEAGWIMVEVSDDGPGFDPETAHAGLGLAGLRERIAGLNGRLDIESAPGKGTRLQMRLPEQSI